MLSQGDERTVVQAASKAQYDCTELETYRVRQGRRNPNMPARSPEFQVSRGRYGQRVVWRPYGDGGAVNSAVVAAYRRLVASRARPAFMGYRHRRDAFCVTRCGMLAMAAHKRIFDVPIRTYVHPQITNRTDHAAEQQQRHEGTGR